MTFWKIAAALEGILILVLLAIVVAERHPGPLPAESPAEQARHAAERDKVMKDFYNPPRPDTRPTGLYRFQAQETQPATR